MPVNVLGPGHDLPERLKSIEGQLASLLTSQAPYIEAGPAPYIPGAWLNAPGGAVTSAQGAPAHVAEWYPFYVPTPVTITAVSVNVTAAQSGWSGLRLAYYNSNLQQFSLGTEFGVIGVNVNGVWTLSATWFVPKGWMWIAAKLEGTGTTIPSFTRASAYVPPFPILGATSSQVANPVYGHISANLSTTNLSGAAVDYAFPQTLTPAGVMTWPPLSIGIQVQ